MARNGYFNEVDASVQQIARHPGQETVPVGDHRDVVPGVDEGRGDLIKLRMQIRLPSGQSNGLEDRSLLKLRDNMFEFVDWKVRIDMSFVARVVIAIEATVVARRGGLDYEGALDVRPQERIQQIVLDEIHNVRAVRKFKQTSKLSSGLAVGVPLFVVFCKNSSYEWIITARVRPNATFRSGHDCRTQPAPDVFSVRTAASIRNETTSQVIVGFSECS